MIWSKSGRDIRPRKKPFFFALQTERFVKTAENFCDVIIGELPFQDNREIRTNVSVLRSFIQKSEL